MDKIDKLQIVRMVMNMKDAVAYNQTKKLLKQAEMLYDFVSKSIERR